MHRAQATPSNIYFIISHTNDQIETVWVTKVTRGLGPAHELLLEQRRHGPQGRFEEAGWGITLCSGGTAPTLLPQGAG